jgi:hypothetical protein
VSLESPVKLGPADPSRVDIVSPAELRWWCRSFDCTREELLSAVAAAGHNARAVERALVVRTGRRPKATSRIRRGRGGRASATGS